MLESYLEGASSQLIARAIALKGAYPRPPKQEFRALSDNCTRVLDRIIQELRGGLSDLEKGEEKCQAVLLEFRRLSSELDRVENAAIAAMSRGNEHEAAVNDLLYQITREIHYPINPPTVSLLSQNYFYINTDFNLLCIPLLELHFLLHLPDIYHEICHPLFLAEDDPNIKPLKSAFQRAQKLVKAHFTKDLIALKNSRTSDSLVVGVDIAYKSWRARWMEEFFCDLFGVFCVGPAYAWAHLHLHAERGRDPYRLPRVPSNHPADAPRMLVMLDALTLLNEKKVAAQIESKWNELLKITGHKHPGDFHRYYPRLILTKCVEEAFEGFKAMQCKPWPGAGEDKVRKTLNVAWYRFWAAPAQYPAWEKENAEALIPTKDKP
jgi:hypothetical protein